MSLQNSYKIRLRDGLVHGIVPDGRYEANHRVHQGRRHAEEGEGKHLFFDPAGRWPVNILTRFRYV